MTSTPTFSVLAVAENLFAAIQRGDVDAVRDVYADDVVIWHNNDGKSQTRDENLAVLGWVIRNIRDLRYEEVRRQATTDGFVQQHVLRGRTKNGAELAIAACIVCQVKEGKITRLDEYLDTAQLAPLLTDGRSGG